MFPLLDREAFERTVLDEGLSSTLRRNKAWVCLYHSILAIGSQFDNRGSFEPGYGQSWDLFSVALASFADLILQPDSLIALQATAAMSVYALGISSLSVEHIIISEAAKRAQNLASTTFTGRTAQMYYRTFWVVYAIEKMSSFHLGRNSVRLTRFMAHGSWLMAHGLMACGAPLSQLGSRASI